MSTAAASAGWWPAIRSSATVSACGRFRYRLGRSWAEQGDEPVLLFVMLNPSTADAVVNDPTIKRCMGFARAADFGGIEVVNLFAYRATKPAALRSAGWQVGPENDHHIAQAARGASGVCVAWGAHAGHPVATARVQQVMPLLRGIRGEPLCLHITASGHPAHPLMLPSTCRLQPFTLQAIADAMDKGTP